MPEWYNDLLYKENSEKTKDGLSSLLDRFESEELFIKHFIENTIFFKKEHIVKQENEYFKVNLEKNEKLFVRFSTKSQKHFRFKSENGRGFSVKKFKNRKEAHDFSRENNLYYKSDNEEEILVKIDKDGNYEVRNQIAKYSKIRVSQGTLISNYTNYTISHIWGKTEHPLFFTALWNITLIPTYLAFILDKPDDNSKIVKKIKLIMKGLCYDFYQPTILTIKEKEKEKEELKNAIESAKKAQIENYNLTFI